MPPDVGPSVRSVGQTDSQAASPASRSWALEIEGGEHDSDTSQMARRIVCLGECRQAGRLADWQASLQSSCMQLSPVEYGVSTAGWRTQDALIPGLASDNNARHAVLQFDWRAGQRLLRHGSRDMAQGANARHALRLAARLPTWPRRASRRIGAGALVASQGMRE